MITGDAKETAVAIGGQLGMQNTEALSGKEIDSLDDTQLSMNVVATSGSDSHILYIFFSNRHFVLLRNQSGLIAVVIDCSDQ